MTSTLDTRVTPASGASATDRVAWTEKSLVWNGSVALVILVLTAGAILCGRRVNHDVAYFIQCAQLLLDGQTPYVGYVDTNPPLVVYVTVPAVFAARLLRVSPVVTFHLFVLALLAASTLALARLLKLLRAVPTLPERGLLLSCWVAATACFWMSREFGQREHLFVLTYVPFLVLRALRSEGAATEAVVARPFAVAIGIAAGIGACLKPHFLLPVVAVEAALWSRHRKPRSFLAPEMIALVVVGLAYAVHFALLPSAMRHAFFGRWLPLINDGYAAYNGSWGRMVKVPTVNTIVAFPLLAAFVGLWVFARTRVAYATLIGALAVMCVGSLGAYVIQRKGWDYHLVPVLTAGAMCAAALLAQAMRSMPDALWRMRRDVARTACLIAPAAAAVCLVPLVHGRNAPGTPFGQFVAAHARPGDKVLIVATSVQPAYPLLVIDNLRPGSRYLCTFPIAFFYFHDQWAAGRPAYHDRAMAPPAERQFLDELESDIRVNHPAVIAVQADGCQGCKPDFNIHDYLRHEGTLDRFIAPGYIEVPGVAAGWHFYLPKTGAAGRRQTSGQGAAS